MQITNYEDEVVFYCLARSCYTDLPDCNPGKMAAQVSHAMIGAIDHLQRSNPEDAEAYRAGYGFGTSIILAATREQIFDASRLAYGISAFLVVDPTYPYIVDTVDGAYKDSVFVKCLEDGKLLFTRREVTCLGLIGKRSKFTESGITNGLNLHP